MQLSKMSLPVMEDEASFVKELVGRMSHVRRWWESILIFVIVVLHGWHHFEKIRLFCELVGKAIV